MIFLAPIVSNYLLTDSRTLISIIAISPVVPIIALTSVIKGYFQGMQNMKPQSIAIVIEQVVRITAVFFLVSLLLPYGVEFAAAGAMISVIIGELHHFYFIFYTFKKKKLSKFVINFSLI